jgi:hypothetical protein
MFIKVSCPSDSQHFLYKAESDKLIDFQAFAEFKFRFQDVQVFYVYENQKRCVRTNEEYLEALKVTTRLFVERRD